MKLFRPALFLTAGLAATAAFAATIPAPPATLAGDVADVIDGVKVADPYRWLEDWDDPKVEAWSDAQNTRTRTYLDALSTRGAVKTRLTDLV
ncbi:MAG: S9 family peptidase, partial [Alphaproteobacteria bacterium]|nr:S9 family peptidase [Alphaproteobacteria bacterium]